MTELEGNLQGEWDHPLPGTRGASEGGAAPLSCFPRAAPLPWSRTAESMWRGKEVGPQPLRGAAPGASAKAAWTSAHLTPSRCEDSESAPRTQRPRSPSKMELEREGPCSLPRLPTALALHGPPLLLCAKIPLQSRGPAPRSYRTQQRLCPTLVRDLAQSMSIRRLVSAATEEQAPHQQCDTNPPPPPRQFQTQKQLVTKWQLRTPSS